MEAMASVICCPGLGLPGPLVPLMMFPKEFFNGNALCENENGHVALSLKVKDEITRLRAHRHR